MSEISPTARALRVLDVLQARPGVTAAELAERLGVTERAARRYVAILREADIPIESTRGPYGGYTLGRSASSAAVTPGRACRTSSARSARAVGLISLIGASWHRFRTWSVRKGP